MICKLNLKSFFHMPFEDWTQARDPNTRLVWYSDLTVWAMIKWIPYNWKVQKSKHLISVWRLKMITKKQWWTRLWNENRTYKIRTYYNIWVLKSRPCHVTSVKISLDHDISHQFFSSIPYRHISEYWSLRHHPKLQFFSIWFCIFAIFFQFT